MTGRQDPAQDSLTEVSDFTCGSGLPERPCVPFAPQAPIASPAWDHAVQIPMPSHFEQFMANSAMGQTSIEYTGSIDPRHEAEMLYRDEMSEADAGTWLASFDHAGRWRNPATGAWESLRSEVYDEATGEWRPAYTGTEYAPGGALEPESPVLKITVRRVDRQTINPPVTVSESGDLSWHSDEPGIIYGVFFHVTHGVLPQNEALSKALNWNLQSAPLRAYHERTGHGYFHLVREPAPEVGTVIDLTPGHRVIMGKTRDAGKLFCGYTCSAEPGHQEAMNARRAEAEADNDTWRSTFDENGRYLDPVTGFWESLNAECYVADTQEWVSAYDDDEAGPVSGTRYPQRATLAAAQIKITKVDDAPLVEFHALPRDNVFPGHAEVVKLIETRVGRTNCINYDEQTGLGAYIVDGAQTPTVATILTLHHGETIIPVEQYWDQLNAHDWHYCFADAGMDAYRSGEANEDRLKAIAAQGGKDYEALFHAFYKHHTTGEPWRNAKWDKPQRPVSGVVVIPEPPTEDPAEREAELADHHATHDAGAAQAEQDMAEAVIGLKGEFGVGLVPGSSEYLRSLTEGKPVIFADEWPINAEQARAIEPKTEAERWVTNFVLGIAALALAMIVSGVWLDLALFEWAGLDRLHQIRDGCILLVIALTLNFATGRVAERNDKPA